MTEEGVSAEYEAVTVENLVEDDIYNQPSTSSSSLSSPSHLTIHGVFEPQTG